MFSISYKSGMAAKRRHFLQIGLHIVPFRKQFIAEQAIHRENSGSFREIPADRSNRFFGNGFIISQLQKNQYIGVIHLSETSQRIAGHIFNGNNTGIVSVNLTKGVLECLCQDFLICHMQDILINLFCRFPI